PATCCAINASMVWRPPAGTVRLAAGRTAALPPERDLMVLKAAAPWMATGIGQTMATCSSPRLDRGPRRSAARPPRRVPHDRASTRPDRPLPAAHLTPAPPPWRAGHGTGGTAR